MSLKRGLIGAIFFILIANISYSQEARGSLLDEYNYVFAEKLVAVAKENYPRIKNYQSRVRNTELKISNNKMGWLSPLSFSYVYSPTNTLSISNPTFFSGYQIGFSFNLVSLAQTPSNVKMAREENKIAKYDFDEYLLTLKTDVITRYVTYLRADKTVKLFTQSYQDAQNVLSRIKY
ncbi:MAG TPA: TolC family protein, partial [Cytophagaceae bacterium]